MWWLMLIPVITIIILWKVLPQEVDWWEYVVVVASGFLGMFIVDWACDNFMAWDTERHGGWVVKCVWDEEWTERYTDTETYTDSKGKTHTRTVIKHRHHPNDYNDHDSNGYEVGVDKDHFLRTVQRFGNQTTEKPWRSGQSSWGDGRRFTTVWRGDEATFTPCFTMHSYENRVAKSHSIMNFREVSEADRTRYGLYEYPEITDYHDQVSILGWYGGAAEQRLARANAKIGALKQVQMLVLVFRNQPLEAGVMQMNYWKNGNKNEIVTCIGIDSKDNIEWVFPFSWDNERLKVDLREDIAPQGQLDMMKVVDTIVPLVEKNWKRKEFSDFDYIKLEPPIWAKVLSFFVVFVVNAIVVFLVIQNDFRPDCNFSD